MSNLRVKLIRPSISVLGKPNLKLIFFIFVTAVISHQSHVNKYTLIMNRLLALSSILLTTLFYFHRQV